MSKRVLLAGLFHETHTFLEGVTSLADFECREESELLDARGDGSPLAGALEVADQCGWDVVPAIDMRATPSAIVADEVLERFWTALKKVAEREAGRIDGVCLILHGAMATVSCDDVEGEVIEQLRRLPGYGSLPICGVLDLHGNISRRSIEMTQGLVAYRCNPHTDACEASRDGARILDRILSTRQMPTSLWEQTAIVWPPTGTGTADDPMRSLEAMARTIEREHDEIVAVNVFGGFAFADVPDTGVSFSAVTFGDPEFARAKLKELSQFAWEQRARGNVVDRELDSVMPDVCAKVAAGETPVVIVEPADNIGGGAPGDATSILRALLKHRVRNSAVVINDAESAATLHRHAVGATVSLQLGGKGSQLGEGPVAMVAELVFLSDGKFELEDRQSHLASMCGVHIDMGPSAVIRHEGVTILVTTRKTPPFDLGQLRSQGIEPSELSVIGVKAAVAHRRAYEKVQRHSYTVSTAGPCSSDLRTFPYQKIRRPVYPL